MKEQNKRLLYKILKKNSEKKIKNQNKMQNHIR